MNYASWIRLAEKYIKTSLLIMKQTIDSGNSCIIIGNDNISWEAFENETQWSDFNTLVPALFLIYHGLELLIKGILTRLEINFQFNHNSLELLSLLDGNERVPHEFFRLINKYIGLEPSNDIISDFLDKNDGLSTSNIHINIRYPDSRTSDRIDFSTLEYNEDTIISSLREIVEDIDSIYRIGLRIVRGQTAVAGENGI